MSCPVIAMGCLLLNFALSSNSYVDSLNDVCSGINMDLSKELSAEKKQPPLLSRKLGYFFFFFYHAGLNVQPILCILGVLF